MSQTVTSVQNGSYTTPGTWNCNCVPANTDNIIIASGDTVLLANNTSVASLNIQSGAQLDNNNNRIEVNGNYIVDGQHTGSGDIRLQGTNAIIGGTGVISNGDDVEILANGMSIQNTAFLTKSGAGSFIISGAFTLTNNGYFICTTDLNGTVATSTFINSTDATLVVSGQRTMTKGALTALATGNTVEFARTRNQNITDPTSSEYYNLVISGSNNKPVGANLTINNDLNLKGGNFRARTNTLTIKGNFINSGGLLDEGSSEFVFSGSTDQYIIAQQEETFFNLRLNKSSGTLILNENVTVVGTLFLNSGIVDARNQIISLGSGIATIGTLTRTGGHIRGTFSRWMNTGLTSYLFPMGDGTNYLPANLNFTTIADGKMNVLYSASFPGSNGLPLGDGIDTIRNAFTEGYWRFTDTSGLAGSTFNVQLTANGFTSYTINSSTRVIGRNDPASNWQIVGSHVAASAPVVNRNGISTLPVELGLGDTTRCTLPSPNTSSITGLSKVCKNTSSVSYSVLPTTGSTYFWQIDGGIQASGGNSNLISVNWGNTGKTGSVQVTESNGCEYASPVLLPVEIQPIDPIAIIGQDVGYDGTSKNVYYVEEQAGYKYNWTVTGVASRAGTGSNDTIFVNFNSSGLAQIKLFYSNACGNSVTVIKDITVVTPIKSIATGNWTNTSTWDCACNPGDNSTVEIRPGHTVTSNVNNEKAYAVLVDSLGSLNITGSRLIISNFLRNAGTISGLGEVRMDQSGSGIVGVGDWIGHSGLLNFRTGTHDISREVQMFRTGDIQLNNSTTVFNHGYLQTSGSLIGTAASSWEQLDGSVLEVSDINWAGGSFDASAIGNNVVYSGTGAFIRDIKLPVSGTYYNLEINGDNANGIYQITGGNIDVLGNLTIAGGQLDASASNFNINVTGDWNNTAGIFNPQLGIVSFVGSDQSLNHSSKETFYNLTLNNTGTLSSNAAILAGNDLIINASSVLDMNDANDYQLNVQGDIFNNGQINFYQNELLMDGAALQNLSGDMNVYDVTIDNSGGVEIDAGTISLSNVLDINAGQFNTKGNLIFKSDASGTAALADLTGGGSIIGNVTVERYLNEESGPFWYMIGSPVTSSTLVDWNSEIYMGGFTGSNNPGSWPTVYRYDIDSIPINGDYSLGYIPPTSINESLNPTEGWMVWIGSSPKVFNTIGQLTTGTISTGTLNYNTNPTGGDSKMGWHLRANPYASPVKWTDVTKSNIANAGEAYVSKPDGNYWAVNSDNINHLYSSESFWVKVNSGGGSLTFDENDKALAVDSFNYRLASNNSFDLPLKLKLTSGSIKGYMDYSVLRFGNSSYTVNYDNLFGESYKVANSHGIRPNIALYDTSNSISIYYNNISPEDTLKSMPLKVWKTYPQNKIENYSLNFEGIEQWRNNNKCLILNDTMKKLSFNVIDTFNYSWSINDKVSDPYLFLNIISPITSNLIGVSCFNEEDGSLEAKGSGNFSGRHTYRWFDDSGNLLKIDSNISGFSKISGLKAGYYQVEVSDNGQCGTMRESFELSNPEPVLADFDFDEVVDLNGDSIDFSNQSINALKYMWNFGDGTSSSKTSPKHKFTEVGKYIVRLTAYQNDDCYSVMEKELIVEDYTSIEKKNSSDVLSVYGFEDRINIKVSTLEKHEIKAEVYNLMGQKLIRKEYGRSKFIRDQISLNESRGIFLVRIFVDDQILSYKVSLH